MANTKKNPIPKAHRLIKNPSDLKYYVSRSTNPYFFSYKTMKFFGDRMSNYGLRSVVINNEPCFELWRKRPVKHGLQSSTFFSKITLEIIRPKGE
jgi:hypothetical protein